MSTTTASRLLGAALALSAPAAALAEAAPDAATIAFKYLHYQDSQPGLDRIRVTSPAIELVTPFAADWSFSASHVIDTISGASPRFHTEAPAKLTDKRHGTAVGLAHYSDRLTLNLGLTYSAESDYVSRGVSGAAAWESEDKNTTWNVGANFLNDTIDPVNHIVLDQHKRTWELAAGVTQVLTQRDIVQAMLGYSHGCGYFSDPYKIFDRRPRQRDHETLLLRWNHHVARTGGTSRVSYRYYRDTFGIRAHTAGIEYVQPVGMGWTVTPAARIYTQTAADFYVEHDASRDPFPTNPPPGAVYSTEEQRLSAYGGVTLGLKVAKQIGRWAVDLKLEAYRQRTSWALFGSGSRNLAPFQARVVQAGAAYQF